MSQYGWCFVVDQKDETRRGWVPGNYITGNGSEPYMSAGGKLEESLWSELNAGFGAGAEAGGVAGGPESIDNHNYLDSPTKT